MLLQSNEKSQAVEYKRTNPHTEKCRTCPYNQKGFCTAFQEPCSTASRKCNSLQPNVLQAFRPVQLKMIQ